VRLAKRPQAISELDEFAQATAGPDPLIVDLQVSQSRASIKRASGPF